MTPLLTRKGDLKKLEVGKLFCVLMVRHSKNKSRAQEVSQRLRDNRELQHFLQNTQDVSPSPGGSD